MSDIKQYSKNRSNANKELAAFVYNKYFDGLPLQDISNILEDNEFKTDDMQGIYCGADGHVKISVSDKSDLILTWHKMASGRFEVVAYIS